MDCILTTCTTMSTPPSKTMTLFKLFNLEMIILITKNVIQTQQAFRVTPLKMFMFFFSILGFTTELLQEATNAQVIL